MNFYFGLSSHQGRKIVPRYIAENLETENYDKRIEIVCHGVCCAYAYVRARERIVFR